MLFVVDLGSCSTSNQTQDPRTPSRRRRSTVLVVLSLSLLLICENKLCVLEKFNGNLLVIEVIEEWIRQSLDIN